MKALGICALGMTGAVLSSAAAVERLVEEIGFAAEPATGSAFQVVAQIGGIAGVSSSSGPTIELHPVGMLSDLLFVIHSGSCTLAARFREDVAGSDELTIVSGFADTMDPLLVPEQMHGYPVTAIADSAFISGAGISRVVFPERIQSVGSDAFAAQSGLLSATFLGNAPASMGEGVFQDVLAGFTIYHAQEASGFDAAEWQSFQMEVITDINYHTVHFDLDGKASADAGELLTQAVPDGEGAMEPRITVHDYWTFIGWDQSFDSVSNDLTVTGRFVLDTDNDGISDAEELHFGTNPVLADSDFDEYDDLLELAFGSDPGCNLSRPQVQNWIVVDADGNHLLLLSFPVWTGGAAAEGGLISSGFRYWCIGSSDMENWTKLVMPYANPDWLPDPPAGCEWITYRLNEPLATKGFLKTDVAIIR